MSYRKICIFRTGALGDVILTLPVIHNLRSAFPKAQIDLVGNPRLLSLAQTDTLHMHDINRAHWAPLFAPKAKIPVSLAHHFQNTDLVISYLPDPDHIFEQNLHRLGIPHVITHPAKPPSHIHAIDHLLSPLDDLTIPIPKTHPQIFLTPKDHKTTSAYKSPHPTLLIHPGSGGKHKCWPPEQFAFVADTFMRQTHCQIILSSGPADGALAQEVAHLMTRETTVLPELPIRQFAAFMTQCTVYLGNDSGPSHLAAALGIPTVTLFGPTDPQVWAPRGPSVHIIQAPNQNMSSLSPDKVIKTIHPFLQSPQNHTLPSLPP